MGIVFEIQVQREMNRQNRLISLQNCAKYGKFFLESGLLGLPFDWMQHIWEEVPSILLYLWTKTHRCSKGTWCHKYYYDWFASTCK